MKKLFLVFAAAGLLLASCSDNENGDDTRRLPSKITYTWLDEDGTPHNTYTSLAYDDQNRLIEIVGWGHWGSDTTRFVYGTGNSPERMIRSFVDGEYSSSSEVEITLAGNLIIFVQEGDGWTSTDTMVINTSMQVVNWDGRTFEYDNNGNISRIVDEYDTIVFTYSNVQSVFRYANVPSWLMNWAFDTGLYPARGYMPAGFSRGSGENARTSTFTHTMDGNWVRTRTMTGGDEFVATFEYINAR